MKKIWDMLFGEKAALVYLAVFAIAIGAATFIENDYGTDTAQVLVYQATWFEVLLFLFAGSIVKNVLKYRLIQRKQWAVLLFHLSIIVILAGSAITRIWGYEGMLHLREGQASNQFLSHTTHLTTQVSHNGNAYVATTPLQATSIGTPKFNEVYNIPNARVAMRCVEAIPNPKPTLKPTAEGPGALLVVFGGNKGRVEYPLVEGRTTAVENVQFDLTGGLDTTAPGVAIRFVDGAPMIASGAVMVQRVMATSAVDTLPANTWHPLALRALYQLPYGQFVFSDAQAHAEATWTSEDQKLERNSMVALLIEASANEVTKQFWVLGQSGALGASTYVALGDIMLNVKFGATYYELPFNVELLDFEMTRYPGTNSPESFASEVRVHDSKLDKPFQYNIHMNHILNYGGYRFFQSSYDSDEKGSYLSVNHDFWGTWVSYAGYFLLTLGMFWALFANGTRFKYLIRRAKGKSLAVLVLLSASFGAVAQEVVLTPVGEAHAEVFSKIIVQDTKGRMKPMHTLSREVLRKVHGKSSVQGITADQFMLSAMVSPKQWYDVKLIKLGSDPNIAKILGVEGKYASYNECFTADGKYKLREYVQESNAKAPTSKNATDKYIIALDERVNIMNMIFNGALLRIIPLENDPSNTWVGPSRHGGQEDLSSLFFGSYVTSLMKALNSGDYSQADEMIAKLGDYQVAVGEDIIPSDRQRSLEIWLNDFAPFQKLAFYYLFAGLILVLLLFVDVLSQAKWIHKVRPVLFYAVLALFLLQTYALGVRWYVSERAPWSNGYESMIYISWTATLAGLLFSRREFGVLGATNVLASTVLFIAWLTAMNPEITPLVPVLKSYWLTIHVSLEAGSYGFLMLGAIVGTLNLLLVLSATKKNFKTVSQKVDQLTAISEIILTSGLYMLAVGTYLGGIWANESWGRYWGWDAKETWALVSILVYAFILHMRFIPKLSNAIAFNISSIVGLASIIMTYFGVNYYLSGLHSYASGDPIPVPGWVYQAAVFAVLLSIAAVVKNRWMKRVVAK